MQDNPLPTDPLALLDALKPKILRTLARFKIPEDEAEKILSDCLLTLAHRQHQLSRPGSWLLTMLRRRCMMYWRRQRQPLYRTVDEAIRCWLSDPGISPEERRRRRERLASQLAELPRPCRAALRRHYDLGYPTAVPEDGLRLDWPDHEQTALHRGLALLIRRLTRAAGMVLE